MLQSSRMLSTWHESMSKKMKDGLIISHMPTRARRAKRGLTLVHCVGSVTRQRCRKSNIVDRVGRHDQRRRLCHGGLVSCTDSWTKGWTRIERGRKRSKLLRQSNGEGSRTKIANRTSYISTGAERLAIRCRDAHSVLARRRFRVEDQSTMRGQLWRHAAHPAP